jgi:Phage integrase, N-terminal SAM-like domain
MTTVAITPLRERMIEDMNARKLCAGTQRGHIRACKRFAGFLKRSPDTATLEDIRRFQLHLAETGVSVCTRNCIMTGLRFLFRVTLRRLDLAEEVYHIREPQKLPLVMSVDEIKRLLAMAASLKTRSAQPRLRLRIAGERDRAAQGQAHRHGAEHHSHRAVQGPQGSQCDAAGRDARLAAAMVEGASRASRCGNSLAGTLALSQQKDCRQADHHPPSQPLVP